MSPSGMLNAQWECTCPPVKWDDANRKGGAVTCADRIVAKEH